MKPEEIRAEEYLNSLSVGNVVFEPRGNVAPDFEVGGDIAVEVRRLNQSYERGGKLRGLEEDRIPLTAKMQKAVEAFIPPDDTRDSKSWFVCFEIRKRPIESWKEISDLLTKFLLGFYSSDHSVREIRLSRSISISLIPASEKLETFFRLGGPSDFEAGGWLVPELTRNIGLCVQSKSAALKSLFAYRERWLLLLDHIGYGHKEDIAIDRGGWDKVILLAPQGKLAAYEPSALPPCNHLQSS